jgi:hypothetical protein
MPGWWRRHPGRSCFLVRPSRDRAKALGLAVPDKLLALANDVVE